jgi:hypothetical protein
MGFLVGACIVAASVCLQLATGSYLYGASLIFALCAVWIIVVEKPKP